jgi:hypothetical protein
VTDQLYQLYVAPEVTKAMAELPAYAQGMIAGVMAVLRADPITVSNVLTMRASQDPAKRMVSFSDLGWLTYEILPSHRLLLVHELHWT